MKKHILNIFSLAVIAVAGLTSCEKDLEVYSDNTCALNFYYTDDLVSGDFKEEMAEVNYSFVYAGSAVKIDTVWFDVRTMGFVYDYPRAFEIEQVMVENAKNAEAGKHYVAFNDPSISQYYQVPAGTSRAKFPVVVLRDASLSSGDVTLKLRIKPNDNFSSGYDVFQSRTLNISASLSKPSLWNLNRPYYVEYYLGAWGPVKHQFMIDKTGEKWNDEFIKELFEGDSGYTNYLTQKLGQWLEEENAARATRGEGPLCEEDGTVIKFEY